MFFLRGTWEVARSVSWLAQCTYTLEGTFFLYLAYRLLSAVVSVLAYGHLARRVFTRVSLEAAPETAL